MAQTGVKTTPTANRKLKARAKRALKAKGATAIVRRPKSLLTLPEQIEKLVMEGDLKMLSVEDRMRYVKAMCHGLGIDWRTRPFAFINLNGAMVLYALRSCTDQLRRVHGISVIESKRTQEGELTIIEVKVRDRTGRTDTGTGAWSTLNLKGEALVNAVLKAETKAKRRATLSIAGLGILDASELDTVDFDEVSAGGRVIEVIQPAALPTEHPKLHDVAFYMQQLEPHGDAATRLAELRKQTPEQIEILFSRYKEQYEKKVSQSIPVTAKAGGAEPVGQQTPPIGTTHSAPSDYDGITFRQLANGNWSIEGPEPLLHANREAVKAVLLKAALPGLACTAEGCGKLQRRFEELKVKFRMVN